jgi:uncharacterized protein YjbK
VSTPYEGGTLFLDRCDYCNVIDYEVEYEVNDYHQGQKLFLKFLDDYGIKQMPTRRKSERAFMCRR